MTWKEVLASNATEVTVKSHGYMERSLISSHFEPFNRLHEIKFKICKNSKSLYNKTFRLEENVNDLDFYIENDSIYVFDPEIMARS